MNLSRDITQDAVVVVPGIMGSALRERQSRKLIWGLSARWYLQYGSRISLGELRVCVLGWSAEAGSLVVPAGSGAVAVSPVLPVDGVLDAVVAGM
jgi:hypothetical protein